MNDTPFSDEEHDPLPTVGEVLALPEMTAGRPEVIVGGEGLERPVRWAHVVAGVEAAALLDGGELILTTGAGWPQEAEALSTVSDQLVSAKPAAVVLEAIANFDSAPPPLIAACERHGVPLVVLHGEVRFVQITQAVHQRILAAQTEALQAREEVHAMLTELGLNRSPVDYVVERLAATLRAPVVLEDAGRRVVAWSGGGAEHTVEPTGLLTPWARARGEEFTLPEGWLRVPVEARGRRWGQLTALPGGPHPAGRRTVLELGAFALALGRLADTDDDQWLRLSSKRLFDTLLGGRYRRDTELVTQLAASGLPVEGRELMGATLRGTGDFGAHLSLERAILETALRRSVAPEGRVIIAPDESDSTAAATGLTDSSTTATTRQAPVGLVLLALFSFPAGDARIASGSGATPPLAARLARELEMLLPSTTPASWRAHLSLGVPGHQMRALVTSLERVRAAGQLPTTSGTGRVLAQQAERQPLAYMVRGFSANPEVQAFAAEVLGPLIAHDRGPGGDLLQVLAAYTAHPTNRSLAAKQARLSRSVFYQRLALIEDLLGVDLADGATIATLAVALLIRREDE